MAQAVAAVRRFLAGAGGGAWLLASFPPEEIWRSSTRMTASPAWPFSSARQAWANWN